MEWSYITREGSRPAGKARVFFACHPEDRAATLTPITADLLRYENCAIYYDPAPAGSADEAELFDCLSQMQLVVIPVTARFLREKNPAREQVMAYAREQNIPVLPILFEAGLEAEFDRACGNLQCLARREEKTGIPYGEKLRVYLRTVLLGDELRERVRGAFDAYIFLSYRKRDRRQAEELMRLIHRLPFARDLAIWYDEYLAPGEDFNLAIEKALRKSEVFALVVTPSLLEEGNYVSAVEYPEARQAGKPILPAVMEPIDPARLDASFAGLPPAVDGRDSAGLSEALLSSLRRIALLENDSDPAHNYLIGLAYLGGIDVEVDRERGVRLITAAAEDGLPEAVDRLVDLYSRGDGVPRDRQKALHWHEKLLQLARVDYAEHPSAATARAWGKRLLQRGYFCRDDQNPEAAKKALGEILQLAEAHPADFGGLGDLLMEVHGCLGDLALAAGDMPEAKACYERCILLIKGLFNQWAEWATAPEEPEAPAMYRRELAFHIGLACGRSADLAEAEGRLADAFGDRELGLKFVAALADETAGVDERRLHSLLSYKCGALALKLEAPASALRHMERALQVASSFAEETGEADDRRFAAHCQKKVGEILTALGKGEEACAAYEAALARYRAIYYEAGVDRTLELAELGSVYRALVHSLLAKGDLIAALDRLNEAIDLAYSSPDLGEHAAAERLSYMVCTEYAKAEAAAHYADVTAGREAEAARHRRIALSHAGAAVRAMENVARILESARQPIPEDDRFCAGMAHRNLAELRLVSGDRSGARASYESAIALLTPLAEASGISRSRGSLLDILDTTLRMATADGRVEDAITAHERLSRLHHAAGEPDSAAEHGRAACDLLVTTPRLLTEAGRERLAGIYRSLEDIAREQGDPARAKAYGREAGAVVQTRRTRALTLKAEDREKEAAVSLSVGNPAAAQKYYRKAIKVRRTLVKQLGSWESRRGLASSHRHLGELLGEQGDPKGAKKQLTLALMMAEALARETGSAPDRRECVVLAYLLGDNAERAGKPAEAKGCYEQSLAAATALAATGAPDDDRFAAMLHQCLGKCAAASGEHSEAQRHYEASLRLYNELVKKTASVTDMQGVYLAYIHLENLATSMGNHAAARQYHDIGEQINAVIRRAGS